MFTCDRKGCQKEAKKHCGKCKVVRYCSVECQRLDWQNGHQASCMEKKDDKEKWEEEWREMMCKALTAEEAYCVAASGKREKDAIM